ncbi:MAG: hypothetical protein AAB641_01725 [Patescibacteria group bacterium]
MPKRPSLLYISFALTVALAILNFLAEAFYLYWTYWWSDWIMHFIAGVAGGLAAYWVLFDSGFWRRRSDKILLPVLSVLICLMIVGVAWEIMEYTFGITDSHEGYRLDVIHDLMMDASGALLAAFIGVRETFLRHG